jgi:hypothetical protein
VLNDPSDVWVLLERPAPDIELETEWLEPDIELNTDWLLRLEATEIAGEATKEVVSTGSADVVLRKRFNGGGVNLTSTRVKTTQNAPA